MTHCSDDDLVLHYYGESPAASEHVAACVACSGRAGDLALVLSAVEQHDATPERGVAYGRDVWERLHPHLDRGASVVSLADAGLTRLAPRRASTSLVPQGGMGWAMAAAAALVLVATSFFAGRLSTGTPPEMAPARAAVNVADPQLARRVLFLSVADHLERSDRVLTDIMNTPEADITLEQQWADDLIATNRLYRQDAIDANEASVADVLDELERTLLDVVHRPSESPADLDQIRRRIDSAALLFKVRVLTTELRQRQLAPDEAPASVPTPIS
jgi:hypothetical protein